jgi:hypothetical protein
VVVPSVAPAEAREPASVRVKVRACAPSPRRSPRRAAPGRRARSPAGPRAGRGQAARRSHRARHPATRARCARLGAHSPVVCAYAPAVVWRRVRRASPGTAGTACARTGRGTPSGCRTHGRRPRRSWAKRCSWATLPHVMRMALRGSVQQLVFHVRRLTARVAVVQRALSRLASEPGCLSRLWRPARSVPVPHLPRRSPRIWFPARFRIRRNRRVRLTTIRAKLRGIRIRCPVALRRRPIGLLHRTAHRLGRLVPPRIDARLPSALVGLLSTPPPVLKKRPDAMPDNCHGDSDESRHLT